MANSLTLSLAAASATVTLSVLLYMPAHPRSAIDLTYPQLWKRCHPVHARVYGQFGNTQDFGEDSKPCPHADYQGQCEPNPLRGPLLRSLNGSLVMRAVQRFEFARRLSVFGLSKLITKNRGRSDRTKAGF
jgi:hypothetical protein